MSKRFSLPPEKRCPDCDELLVENCPKCSGAGELRRFRNSCINCGAENQNDKFCSKCGKEQDFSCWHCKGTGEIEKLLHICKPSKRKGKPTFDLGDIDPQDQKKKREFPFDEDIGKDRKKKREFPFDSEDVDLKGLRQKEDSDFQPEKLNRILRSKSERFVEDTGGEPTPLGSGSDLGGFGKTKSNASSNPWQFGCIMLFVAIFFGIMYLVLNP